MPPILASGLRSMDFAIRGSLSHDFEPRDFKAITAIPVRNEADHIDACLDALGQQRDAAARPMKASATVLLLNGCDDGTWKALQRRADRAPAPERWLAVDCELPRTLQHAGGARKAALAIALRLAGPDTRLIATTDADSRVPCDWISRQLDALAAGAGAVAGAADIDAKETSLFPAGFRQRIELESCYTQWLERVDALLDPLLHDPWPRHRTPTGASLGFSPETLRLLQPLPAPSLGEDRALMDRCRALDIPIRFDAMLRVHTSGRLKGRAEGGMADTMAHRLAFPEAACDVLLEPFTQAADRSKARAWLRTMHRLEALQTVDAQRHFGLAMPRWRRLPLDGSFGRLWQELEQCSPRLRRIPMLPRQLPEQIGYARCWWQSLRKHGLPPMIDPREQLRLHGTAAT